MSSLARSTFATLLFLVNPARAVADCDLDELIGYTLATSKYVSGYIENNERKNGFEGCNYDRIIVFDDNTGLRCTSYSYTYAYHPKAYIFVNGSSIQACISGSIYNLGPL
jgi:hypothetical protein